MQQIYFIYFYFEVIEQRKRSSTTSQDMLKELTEILSKTEFKQPHFLRAEAEVKEILKF